MVMVALLVAGCDLDINIGNWGPNIQGSGVSQTEQRDVGDITAIKCMIAAKITVTQAEQPAFSITADDNLLPIITTETVNGTLKISAEESYSTPTTVQIQIKVPMISRVEVLGCADVLLDSVTDEKLELKINGSGDIEAIGKVRSLDAQVNGCGDLRLKELQTQDSRLKINGSGDAELFVTDSLDAQVNGSGDIAYHGNPASVHSKVNGCGSIVKK
jgi:hypothetical protein